MALLWNSFMSAPDYFEISPWFPNPAICVRDMVITGAREVIDRMPWDGPAQWINATQYWVSRIKFNDPACILLPLLLAVILTLLRLFLTWAVYRVRWSGVSCHTYTVCKVLARPLGYHTNY